MNTKTIAKQKLRGFFLAGALYLTLLPAIWSQSPLDSLKTRLAETYGKDKLVVLNELVAYYLITEPDAKEALRYARSAEALAETIIAPENQLISDADYYLKPLASLQMGQLQQELGRYPESRAAYENALVNALQFNAPEIAEQAQNSIQKIELLNPDTNKKKKGFLGKAFQDISTSIDQTTNEFGVLANLKLARMLESNQKYDKAIKKYELAINQLRDQGDWEQVTEIREHIAGLLEKQGDQSAAVVVLKEIKQEKENQGDHASAADLQDKIDLVYQHPKIPASPTPPQPVSPNEAELTKAEAKLRDIRYVAERAENNRDYEASLNYYKQYLAMEQTLSEQEKTQELALLEKAHQLGKQEQEIALLRQNEEINRLQLVQNQVELERQLASKRTLAGGLSLSGLLALSLLFLYRNKRRDHEKLGLAYQDLEATQGQLKIAEKRIIGLLNQQVSGAVAHELLSAKDTQVVQRRFVCIMFLDIRDFTPYVEKLSPEDIIEYQNKVLGFMIETVNKRNGIVNQILGDGFMATFGAPVSAGNDCQEAYLAAEEIIRTVREKSESGEIPPTRIGIGLHAGHVVAGNVGTKERKQYSITGNPVIIAARLEQLNKEFSSTMVVSKEVYDHLPVEMQKPMEFNQVAVKGRS